MKKILFIAIACLLLNFFVARADQKKDVASTRILAEGKTYVDWCASQIVPGDDSPYDAIKHFIDKDAKSGSSAVEADYQKYKDVHLKSPKNLEYLYGYFYSAHTYYGLNGNVSSKEYESGMEIFDVIGLKMATLPHTFAWAKLVFTVMPGPEAAGMGERLIALDPNDDEVKYQLSRNLAYYSKDIIGRQKGIEIAKEQIAKHKDSASYANLGSVYSSIYFWTHDPKYADLGIEAYNNAMARQTDQKIATYRKGLERLRGWQAQFEAQKKK
jgi:hypothetical protein